jgi:hypothetical protein
MARTLKLVSLVFCLILISFVSFMLFAVTADGCTKYVPLPYVRSLYAFVWQLWAISFVLNLIVLLLFLSDFLRRPRFLMQHPAISTFALLLVWKIAAIASAVQVASSCGQARDYDFPMQLTWLDANFLFFAEFSAWIAMIVFAAISVSGHTKKA